MKELLDIVLGDRFLAFSNLILICCLAFHQLCEWAHYIHEFFSHRKEAKRLVANNKLLTDMMSRIEKIEKTQQERGGQQCPLKNKANNES
jgi:hypothetical protein